MYAANVQSWIETAEIGNIRFMSFLPHWLLENKTASARLAMSSDVPPAWTCRKVSRESRPLHRPFRSHEAPEAEQFAARRDKVLTSRFF